MIVIDLKFRLPRASAEGARVVNRSNYIYLPLPSLEISKLIVPRKVTNKAAIIGAWK